MKKFVIIDAYALAHRSYHALPPLVSPKGVLVNGVYGFMLILLKMIQELKPDYLIAAFDTAKPTFRHKAYKEYKAKRVKAPDNFYEQINIIKNILTIWGIPILFKEGYEADDIIGAIADRFAKANLEIIILTGDLDTLQLVNDKTSVYTLRKGLQDSVIYDIGEVRKKYNLSPEQLIDFKALKGDSSDNVPGILGIGEKTALKLIQEFGTLDKLYSGLDKQSPAAERLNSKLKTKLVENKNQAYSSRYLVMIDKNINLDFHLEEGAYHPPLAEKLEPLLKQLGFQSLIKKLFEPAKAVAINEPKQKIKIETISSSDIGYLQGNIQNALIFGIYLDCGGYKFQERTIKNLYFIFPEQKIFALPPDLFSKISDLTFRQSDQIIFTLGAKALIEEIPQFIGLELEDIEILAWLIDANRKNYTLESLVRMFLKKTDLLSFEEILADFLNLAQIIRAKASSLSLNNVWATIEKPLIPVLSQMEENGIFIDKAMIEKLRQEVGQELEILENKIYQTANKKFNINSYQQLSALLFEGLGIKGTGLKKTNSGKYSTDISELIKIQNIHPIIPLIINYRQLSKLQTAFLDPLPGFINRNTNKIHTIWKQTGTATGRLSSEEPNLQNIPLKGEWGQKIRAAFKASSGFSFISLDYSQIELRVAAHLSLDQKLIEAFKEGRDIHTLTASYINNVPEDEVTSQMRQLAKILNFGIIYGMGDKAFSEMANISLKEAKQFKQEYFNDFWGLKNYLNKSLEQAKTLGYAETIFGRKRLLPLIGSLGKLGRQEERIAVNMPIQGSAADIIKLTMIKIFDFIRENRLEKDIKLILQIHDELILEVKSAIIKEAIPRLKDIMERVVVLEVPLKTEIYFGQNLGELEKYSE